MHTLKQRYKMYCVLVCVVALPSVLDAGLPRRAARLPLIPAVKPGVFLGR